MNVDVNMFKEKSKSISGWNSIKKSKQGNNKSRGWKSCKIIMVSKKVKIGTKEAKAFTTQTYSPTCLNAKLQWRWWGPEWKEKDDTFKGRAPFE